MLSSINKGFHAPHWLRFSFEDARRLLLLEIQRDLPAVDFSYPQKMSGVHVVLSMLPERRLWSALQVLIFLGAILACRRSHWKFEWVIRVPFRIKSDYVLPKFLQGCDGDCISRHRTFGHVLANEVSQMRPHRSNRPCYLAHKHIASQKLFRWSTT